MTTPNINAPLEMSHDAMKAFADKVRGVLPRAAKFHDDRAFIGSVRELCGYTSKASRVPFAAALFACHRAGLLRITRADMVRAMDPELVKASEFTYLGEISFHFVVVD